MCGECSRAQLERANSNRNDSMTKGFHRSPSSHGAGLEDVDGFAASTPRRSHTTANGALRLVGVEFIVDAVTWLAANNNTPPVLEGQVFNYVGAPNRFNINSFFELHVWAWRDNPQGAYVDWNNNVSCLGQQGPA